MAVRPYILLVAFCAAALVLGGLATPGSEAAAKKKAKRPSPYAGCYHHTFRPYNFGFYSLAPLDYSDGVPVASPYTPIPDCRVTTAARGDRPSNRIDDARIFSRTNARVGVLRLRPEAMDPVHQAWPLYDSLAKVAAWIRAVPQPYNRTLWQVWSKDWGGPAAGGGHLLATRNMSPDVAPLRVQGRACMTSRALVNNHFAVQFPNLRSELPGLESSDIGRPSAWGFLPVAALDFSDVWPSDMAKLDLAQKHDTPLVSCGRRHPLTSINAPTIPLKLSLTPFAIPKHNYLGGTSWQRCNPDDPGALDGDEGLCGTYAQYWAVPGTGLRVIASSTTGIAGGGLPLALVPDHLKFRAIRHVGYCDRNIPRVQTSADSVLVPGRTWDGQRQIAAWNRGGHVIWIYGKFWVAGHTKWIYGWTPEPCERLAEVRAAFLRLNRRK